MNGVLICGLREKIMSEFNKVAWAQACDAWEDVSELVGFEKRSDAFRQGYYMAANMFMKDEDDRRAMVEDVYKIAAEALIEAEEEEDDIPRRNNGMPKV